jgi:excisionase family DNA binding protein
MTDDDAIFVDTWEAARRLSVSPRTIFALRKRGELPWIRRGRKQVLFRVEDLKAWAEKQPVIVTAKGEAA